MANRAMIAESNYAAMATAAGLAQTLTVNRRSVSTNGTQSKTVASNAYSAKESVMKKLIYPNKSHPGRAGRKPRGGYAFLLPLRAPSQTDAARIGKLIKDPAERYAALAAWAAITLKDKSKC